MIVYSLERYSSRYKRALGGEGELL